MRILFSSHVFPPSVGGLERVSEMLAAEFCRQGHELRLITQTPGPAPDAYPFPVFRRPARRELLAMARWCDVFFHNNISLPAAWPLVFTRRKWVVAHHVWIPRQGMAGRLKRLALRFAHGIAISRAVADHLATPSVVIPNPYDEAMFRRLDGVVRDRDLVFVGRLVSDKGVDVLLRALAMLKADGLRPSLTVIGSGPEEAALRDLARVLGLEGRIEFAGKVTGPELTRQLNRHRLIVVPSLWDEPFGLVALEGIACGCVAVGSRGGGLADAIGPCGATFANGDPADLARVLGETLGDPDRMETLRSGAPAHLAGHRLEAVAAAYLKVFSDALAG